MTRRFVRPIVAVAGVLTIAAAGVALQPEGRPGRPPQGQPGERGPGERGPGERGPGGRGQQVSVEGAMKGMNRAMRQLHANIGDASKRADNLRLINDMERSCVMAKGAPLPDDITEKVKGDAAKAEQAEDFRQDLVKALRLMLDIETDIADGKTDAATAKLEELKKARDNAHKELGVKDKD